MFHRDYAPPEPVVAGYIRHPLAAMVARAKKRNPASLFWIQEDGRLLEQPHLFRAYRPPKGEVLDRERHEHEQRFRRLFAFRSGIRVICAGSEETLAWFRRDAVRLLDRRTCFRRFPEMPDPRDPLRHFVLALDREIRFASVDRAATIHHLDGDEQTRRYRMLRFTGKGKPRWQNTPVEIRMSQERHNRLIALGA
jgi:hypothetical protein